MSTVLRLIFILHVKQESLIFHDSVLVTWKPVLMVWTLQEEWQVMHCRKNKRVSLFKIVSGDLKARCSHEIHFYSMFIDFVSVYFVLLFLLKTWWLCTCMYGRWHTPWCTASTRFLCASAEISLKTRFRDIAHIGGRLQIHLSWWVGCCRQWRRLCQAPQRGTRANAEIGECLSLKAG